MHADGIAPSPPATLTVSASAQERARPKRTLRFEPTQTWTEKAAEIHRELCAEMRGRAGFEMDENCEAYELELQASGEIQRWRIDVKETRALTSFELAVMTTVEN